jgi:hypothetical protein
MTSGRSTPASSTEPGAGDVRRRGGPPVWFALIGIVGLAVGIVMIAAQVLGIGTVTPRPGNDRARRVRRAAHP